MERSGYWLHKWTDETSSFDPHGRWSGGLDCYERDYSMWIPDRIKPDDTVAVNDYIDRQFELSAEVADGLEVIDAADAQATIAALQARVQELEQWVQDQSTANLETMRHTDEMQSRAMEAEQQLTQRTAERDTARRRVDELEAREVDVVLLRDDLEKRTAELEAANKLLYKKNCELGRFETIISDLQAELERVRSLVEALPKVEGEIRLIHADDGDWHVVDLYDAIFTDKSWAVSYAALLQHRQGMEG